MGRSTISMVIFNSYFDITRGYVLLFTHPLEILGPQILDSSYGIANLGDSLDPPATGHPQSLSTCDRGFSPPSLRGLEAGECSQDGPQSEAPKKIIETWGYIQLVSGISVQKMMLKTPRPTQQTEPKQQPNSTCRQLSDFISPLIWHSNPPKSRVWEKSTRI